MSDIDDKLNEVLNIVPEVIEPTEITTVETQIEVPEDKDAEVDANIVMTGSGKYVEVQSSGEEATYSEEQLNALISLGKQGIETLTEIQKEAIASGL